MGEILDFSSSFFQLLNSQVTTAQHMEREKAYDVVNHECVHVAFHFFFNVHLFYIVIQVGIQCLFERLRRC